MAAPHRATLAEDAPFGEGDAQVLRVRALHDASDLVFFVCRRAGGGPDLREADEAARVALDRAPEQEVGEGEIGQQLPFGDEPLEVRGGVRRQLGVGADDITEC